MAESVNIEEWKRKRTVTLRVFRLQSLLVGMDTSVTFLTLWIYITTLVETNQPKIFYSLVSASYLLSGVMFSLLIGRLADQTRSVRLLFIICNCLVIVGNVTYALHYSPWLLVLGRFVAGIGGPLRSIVSGEVSRCYPADQLTSKLSAMSMSFLGGFVSGPAISFAFKNVDITIGSLHVTYANISGFYMAFIFFCGLIVVMLYVHDLSKEFDLKASLISEEFESSQEKVKIEHDEIPSGKTSKGEKIVMRNDNVYIHCIENINDQEIIENYYANDNPKINKKEETNQPITKQEAINQPITNKEATHEPIKKEGAIIAESSSNIENVKIEIQDGKEPNYLSQESTLVNCKMQTTSIYKVFLQDMKDFDIVFIFILSYFMYFWIVAFDMWLPMIVIDTLGMGVTELNSIVFGEGVVCCLVLLGFSKTSFSDQVMFKMSLGCMVSLAIMEGIFASMILFPMTLYVNIILWVIWASLFAFLVLTGEVFLIGVLAKMTASNIQTFNESLRVAMTRFGALTALLVSSLVFDYLEYICLFAIIFALVSLVVLILRRKSFKNPVLKIK